MKIIVISKTDYRENDVIINAISENEELSFLVRGLRNPKSPFKWLNTPLTCADVEFVEPNTYKHPVLKRASLISSPLSKDLSLDKMLCLSLVSEASIKMLDEDERPELYPSLISFANMLGTVDANPHLLALVFLAKTMKIAGFLPEINECVKCGTKEDIIAFSFNDGGLVCRKCADENTKKDLTPNQMKLLRVVFLAPNFAFTVNDALSKDDMVVLLLKFKEFINDTIGVELENISLLCNL